MNRIKLVFILLFVSQSYAQISDFKDIDFKKADSLAMAYKEAELTNLPLLSKKLTSNLKTDVEKFRAIYMWVCTNIENDFSLYLKYERKNKRFQNDSLEFNLWQTDFKKTVFKTLVEDHKTICTGYAYLVKTLAHWANLECELVHGYGRTSTTDIDQLNAPNHSWNAVKLNNKWYLCDPTWASGKQNAETFRFSFQYNDGYFLAEPKLFAVNHFPADAKWLLLDENPPTFADFLNAPVIYGKAYTNLKRHNAPQFLNNTVKKHETVTFEYELLNAINCETVKLVINNGRNNKTIRPNSTTLTNTALVLEHEFTTTGLYDVHVLIGDDLISTYTFEVKG
ncbi:transglutaminase domain-containing protein [Hanstruepera marina]|uniref:transglutaminase domain-containing protein n=1 Tax=Hanstruepera marina TaxID=2873265 RepID=UPI00210485B4|nr:transglutaminase domain-containing protein [Hanstruepera marina]